VKKAQREEIKKNMELDDGKIRILLATYGTLSTGVSIKNLHNIIFAEGFKAEQRIIQSIGRSLRLHETKAVASIYDLVDTYSEEKSSNVLLRHGKDRINMYDKHEYPYKISKFLL
jgi:superfamily II DNA or RNA helicase